VFNLTEIQRAEIFNELERIHRIAKDK